MQRTKMAIKIYHNPACGTSRNVLETLINSGKQVEVIEYLKTPPSTKEIKDIVKMTGGNLRDLVREKGTPYHELGLENASDEEILSAMEEYPILLNRPIVVIDKRAKLCRPSETVKQLLG